MHVVQVAHGFPPLEHAGAELCAYYLARELGGRGHTVRAFVRTSLEEMEAYETRVDEVDGVSVTRLRTPAERAVSMESTYRDTRAREQFEAFLGDEVDVVHMHHAFGLGIDLIEAAQAHGARVVMTLHDFWAHCPRGQRLTPRGHLCDAVQPWRCSACVAKKRARWAFNAIADHAAASLRRPFHAALAGASYVRDNLARRPIDLRTARIHAQLERADVILAPSQFVLDEHRRHGLNHPRMIHSDNGVEADWTKSLAPLEAPRSPLRVGFVGTFLPAKGVEVLLEAGRRLGDAPIDLHLHGTSTWDGGAYHRRLEAKYGGPRIQFHGRFGRDGVADVFDTLDVLVVPSVWYENAPLTLDEAALARRPVVVSDHGGMRETVRERGNGLTFRPGDADDLARALRRFVDEPALWPSLRDSRTSVRTVGEQADEMEALYRSLGASPSSSSR